MVCRTSSVKSSFSRWIDGAADGYRFIVSALKRDSAYLLAEPVPGVTGSESVLLRVAVTKHGPATDLRFIQTPGSAEGRNRMFGKVMSAGARAVSQLTLLLPFVEQGALFPMTVPFLRDVAHDDDTVRGLLGSLSGVGGFSPASLYDGAQNFEFGDGSVREVFQGFVQEVFAAMHLGANGENWRLLPAVQVAAEPTLAVFNLDDLSRLTRLYVLDDQQEERLIGYLTLARAADESQLRMMWLGKYIGALERMRGTALPAVQAETLLQIARSLGDGGV